MENCDDMFTINDSSLTTCEIAGDIKVTASKKLVLFDEMETTDTMEPFDDDMENQKVIYMLNVIKFNVDHDVTLTEYWNKSIIISSLRGGDKCVKNFEGLHWSHNEVPKKFSNDLLSTTYSSVTKSNIAGDKMVTASKKLVLFDEMETTDTMEPFDDDMENQKVIYMLNVITFYVDLDVTLTEYWNKSIIISSLRGGDKCVENFEGLHWSHNEVPKKFSNDLLSTTYSSVSKSNIGILKEFKRSERQSKKTKEISVTKKLLSPSIHRPFGGDVLEKIIGFNKPNSGEICDGIKNQHFEDVNTSCAKVPWAECKEIESSFETNSPASETINFWDEHDEMTKGLFNKCEKYDHSAKYTLFKNFKMEDLPPNLLKKGEKILPFVQQFGLLTVKIKGSYKSSNRSKVPPTPEENMKYPDCPPFGSGIIVAIFPEPGKENFYKVHIRTGKHVLFDDAEINSAEATIDDDMGNIKILYGVREIESSLEHDSSLAEFETNDDSLANTIYEALFKKKKLTLDLMSSHVMSDPSNKAAIVISYPHGGNKCVSFGKIKKQKLLGQYCTYGYDAPTCPGSSGAPVILFGLPSNEDCTAIHSRTFENLNYGGAYV